jgi:hypothetical protein
MDRNDDKKLDSMLHSRRTQAASPDLAARIIHKAQGLPQIQRFLPWQSLRQLFIDLHLPKPGYVLASALVLGMFLGFSTAPQSFSPANSDNANAQSFLADDEGLL